MVGSNAGAAVPNGQCKHIPQSAARSAQLLAPRKAHQPGPEHRLDPLAVSIAKGGGAETSARRSMNSLEAVAEISAFKGSLAHNTQSNLGRDGNPRWPGTRAGRYTLIILTIWALARSEFHVPCVGVQMQHPRLPSHVPLPSPTSPSGGP
ncbi:hypothetical protein B0T16DRAFT_95900 [Cercophora newfieldiana]|uniref:Uncharacterized protein n=1 Tax=Cercophora newfieldiana TaxID=92897 RepID=A0AA39YIH5_9PEZI|nr:hypothetical protein B0T16DRAFT_95900 [Cercophora newfieldiana]